MGAACQGGAGGEEVLDGGPGALRGRQRLVLEGPQQLGVTTTGVRWAAGGGRPAAGGARRGTPARLPWSPTVGEPVNGHAQALVGAHVRDAALAGVQREHVLVALKVLLPPGRVEQDVPEPTALSGGSSGVSPRSKAPVWLLPGGAVAGIMDRTGAAGRPEPAVQAAASSTSSAGSSCRRRRMDGSIVEVGVYCAGSRAVALRP
jgi:hypothetical protein